MYKRRFIIHSIIVIPRTVVQLKTQVFRSNQIRFNTVNNDDQDCHRNAFSELYIKHCGWEEFDQN